MRISYTLKTLIYVILTSTAFNMLAQSTQAFRHITLNRLNGLKHDNRNVFLGSDSQGYLWIGSNNGAYRYDGQSFTRYFVGDPRFNNTVKSQFFEDNKGIVWYGTPSGLVSFDTKDFQVKSYPLRTSFASQFGYHLIRRDSLTSSWFASNGTELLAIEESESNPKHLAQSKGVRHLLLKTEGSLIGLSFPWLLKQGLERVYQESKTGQLKISESKDKTIQSATINGGIQFTDSTAWLTSNIGLIGYNFLKDSSFIVSSFPDQKSAQRIWAAAVYDSLLLIATDQNGLWWFDPIKRKYIGELKSNSPKLTDQPRAIHVSNSGEILISRATGGVDVLIPQKFSIELLLASDSTDDNPIQVLSTEDSTAWILTTKGSLYKFQNNVLERKFDLGIKATERRNCHFTIDPTSTNFIISYGSSLISLDSSTWKIRSKTNVTPLTISNIFSIDSSILVTTDTSIYNYSDGKITPIDITNLNSPAFIKCTPLSKGRIAINKGGSNLYITTVPKAKLVVIDTITFRGEFMSILQREPSDKILLGTSEGLFQAKQNNELSRWIIDTPALTNRFIQKIASRNDSIIWVRTSNGLGRLRSQKWDWIFHEKELENLPNYSKGLAILKDEGVLLSSKQGLFAIRSSNSDREAEERIVVSQYWKDGILQKPIAEISDTVLSTIRTAQDFQFSFSTVGIYSSEPIRIRYRVIGASTGWRVVGEDRVLRLEQLPVGRHILEVQGLTLDQITTKPLHITIDIHIPYWETR